MSQRKRIDPENPFYDNYVSKYCREVPFDAPTEDGKVYHTMCQHEDLCASWDETWDRVRREIVRKECSCNPIFRRWVEPEKENKGAKAHRKENAPAPASAIA